MYLPSLTDQELLVHAERTMDPITTSDLERELMKRLQARLDDDPDDSIMGVLGDHNIFAVDDLKAHFDVVDAIKAKAEEL